MENHYKSRINCLREYLSEQKIDIAMVISPINIYYFTGFYSNPHERFMALVIDNRRDNIYLFVPLLDLDIAEQSSYVGSIIPITDTENPYKIMQSKVGAQIKSIGVEKNRISYYQYKKIEGIFPKAKFMDIDEFIISLRLKKTSEEIIRVKRAVELIENVMEVSVNKITLGMTEIELAAELEYQMRILGGDKPAFSSIVLVGKRSSLPHGVPSNYRIEQNEFLLIDIGVFVDGYCSDVTRTFLVGEGTDTQKKIYEIVLEANQKAIETVKVGEYFGTVDRVARKHIEACGFGKYFIHRIGHGIGLEVHEEPSIHQDNDLVIEPGFLFTIEPGIYIPDIGGVRIEDDVYINENGEVQVLTTYPKELRRLCC